MRPVTHYCRFVYLSLLVLLVLPFSALAENYTVEGIHVEATGQTATEARQRAMAEAENKGFFELIKRLSDEATAARLSQSHQGSISLMVQSTQINNEKMSATSYMADINLIFNADQIQALMAQSGVTPIATTGTPGNTSTLVLPVFTQNNQTVLLGSQNPWWDAWNNIQINNSAVTFILPIGDLEDISMTPMEAVRSNNYEQLKALADKYHVSRILVADATYGEDIETKNPALSVAIFDVKPEGTTNSSMEFNGAPNQPMVELLAQGVNGLVAGLNSNWKNQQQLSTEALNKILVKASFANLREWKDIQRRLKSVETVQKTAVERVAGRYAVVVLYSSSTAEELPQHLEQSGFIFTPAEPMPLIQLVTH